MQQTTASHPSPAAAAGVDSSLTDYIAAFVVEARADAIPARFAAFANGLAIHADDYDDTQLAVAKDRVYGLLTHPTAPALAAVLAIAERDGRSGRDLMTAYHVAVEVESKVAEAILPRHYQHGFHSTATCGAIGSAAGSAKLLGLDVAAARRALSIGA